MLEPMLERGERVVLSVIRRRRRCQNLPECVWAPTA